jgi:hypothetical protein
MKTVVARPRHRQVPCFDRAYLDQPLIRALFVGNVHGNKSANQFPCYFFAEDASTQHQDVHVILLYALVGGVAGEAASPHYNLSRQIWNECPTCPGCCKCPSARDPCEREPPRHRAPEARKPARPESKRPLNRLRMAVAALALPKFPQRLWNLPSCQQIAGGGVNLSGVTKRMRKRKRDQQNHGVSPGQ